MQENKSAAGRIPREEYRLDLFSVLNEIKDQWISVLLLTVSVVLLSYVMLSARRDPSYVTTATIAASYVDEDPDINSSAVPDVHNALKYAGETAKNLKTILARSDVRYAAAKESGLSRISGSVSAENNVDTNLFVIKDTAGSPEASLKEVQALVHYLQAASDELLGGIRITVVSEPRLVEQPVSRSGLLKYAIAIGIVFFVMICSLLAWYSSTKYTVRNSGETASKLGTDLLAVIPHERQRRGGNGLLITDPAAAPGFAEEMRSLAVRLMNEMSRDGKKILLISSAARREGKSTAAANIALAMSQMNRKVILADLDFRNPSLARILNMQAEESTDLMQLLEKQLPENQFSENGAQDAADLNGLIRQVPGTELQAVLIGKAAPLAADKYAAQVRKCLELLADRADFVIIDAASAGSASDAEILASMTDAAAIVVRENYAEVTEIERAISALSKEGRLLGCVFNNARNNAVSADAKDFSNGGQYAG